VSKVLVILPAYNEETTVAKVIGNVRAVLPEADLVVVNDCSRDKTSEVARGTGARVLDLAVNLGIGGAMQAGYRFADQRGYDVAIQVDADGQHDPKEIPRILDPVLEGKADIVIGSRFSSFSGYRFPLLRRIGSRLFSWAVSSIVGQRITDTTSGFRAANRKVIRLYALQYPQDYPEVEAVVMLHRAGFLITEVPVRMNPRLGGDSSISPLRGVYYMIKVPLAIFIGLFRSGKARPIRE
jgi:glycosyltransferase involved in cell wall biosynthesis